jgi:hypothetical protein
MESGQLTDQETWDIELWNVIMGGWSAHIDYLEQALQNGANVAKVLHGTSPLCLQLCSVNVQESKVELLVKYGAKSKDTTEEKKMFRTYIQNFKPGMLQFLFDKGVFEYLEIEDFTFALHYLAKTCQPHSVHFLRICIFKAIAVGIDVHEVMTSIDSYGKTLIHNAVNGTGQERRPAMIRVLIMNGADSQQQDRQGHTPEECAIIIKSNTRQKMKHSIHTNWLCPGSNEIISVLQENRVKLEKIAEQRRIAFAMGQHDHLGSGSILNSLHPELMSEMFYAYNAST